MVFLRVISQDTAALGKLSKDSETQKDNIVQKYFGRKHQLHDVLIKLRRKIFSNSSLKT